LRANGKYLLYTNFPSRRVGILFWLRDSHFYPYEAPGGAEAFWSFTFLSIRSPWRGRGVLEFHISIHTKPLAGQRRFGVSHFYPYEAPGGAEAFWSFTFLSIRSPWRGRGVLEFHISIHTKPLAGQRRFGVSHFYPYEAPGGAEAFWSFTFLSIRSPWRGRGVLEFHISIHTKPLAGQRRFGVSHYFYEHDTPTSRSYKSPIRGIPCEIRGIRGTIPLPVHRFADGNRDDYHSSP
jgi:hypothetical protein